MENFRNFLQVNYLINLFSILDSINSLKYTYNGRNRCSWRVTVSDYEREIGDPFDWFVTFTFEQICHKKVSNNLDEIALSIALSCPEFVANQLKRRTKSGFEIGWCHNLQFSLTVCLETVTRLKHLPRSLSHCSDCFDP